MSVHVYVGGDSGTGKSRVMKQRRILDHRRAGQRVAVLDPVGTSGWGADFQTDDPERFIAVVRASRGIVAVVDEWPYIQDNWDWTVHRQLNWIWGVGRNHGILGYAIGQTPMWVPKPVRRQCGHGILFRHSDPGDCIELARIYCAPELARILQTLPDGVCALMRGAGTPPVIHTAFPDLERRWRATQAAAGVKAPDSLAAPSPASAPPATRAGVRPPPRNRLP